MRCVSKLHRNVVEQSVLLLELRCLKNEVAIMFFGEKE